jgi:hypothetical protein
MSRSGDGKLFQGDTLQNYMMIISSNNKGTDKEVEDKESYREQYSTQNTQFGKGS